MDDWRIFKGERAEPHDAIQHLPDPPPWRQLGLYNQPLQATEEEILQDYWEHLQREAAGQAQAQQRGRNFHLASDQEDVLNAVNAALYLRRPLLVTGKPGSGKTSLAYAVAYQLQLGPVLVWPITARSTLQDSLYLYDALARLQDAQLSGRARQNPGEPQPQSPYSDQAPDIGQYITLGPVGTAFLPSLRPRVLLIDEIDKSDINLPNDLLNLFEEGEYEIPPLIRQAKNRNEDSSVSVRTQDGHEVQIHSGRVRCRAFPFVIMTNNGERDFPPAFLRRCLRVRMPDPTPESLLEIVRSHFGSKTDEALEQVEKLIADFREDEDSLATDQLLNTVYMILGDNDINLDDKTELKRLLLKRLSSAEDR